MADSEEAIVRRVAAETLSARERWMIGLRGLIMGLPWVGSSIEKFAFGPVDERRWKRTKTWIEALAKELGALRAECEQVPEEFFHSDEFAYLLEGVIRRVLGEVEAANLDALRGILVSVIITRPSLTFEKQRSFLKTVDIIEGTHIRVLQLLASRSDNGQGMLVEYPAICHTLDVVSEADIRFVYSSLDTLANREFIQSGPIPFDDNMNLIKKRQSFRITALGEEFLEFIRMPPVCKGRSVRPNKSTDEGI